METTYDEKTLRYLKTLSRSYPNTQAVTTEIINLRAVMNLPKGTEHYISDIHGEYQGLRHILRNASGSVRRKIDQALGDYVSAADALDPDPAQLLSALQGDEVQGVGMLHILGVLLREYHLAGHWSEGVGDRSVGAVALSGLAQGSVEIDLVAVSLREPVLEQPCRLGRPHGMGAGRSHSDLVYIPYGLHDTFLSLPAGSKR